jgi:hypothetical protein
VPTWCRPARSEISLINSFHIASNWREMMMQRCRHSAVHGAWHPPARSGVRTAIGANLDSARPRRELWGYTPVGETIETNQV